MIADGWARSLNSASKSSKNGKNNIYSMAIGTVSTIWRLLSARPALVCLDQTITKHSALSGRHRWLTLYDWIGSKPLVVIMVAVVVVKICVLTPVGANVTSTGLYRTPLDAHLRSRETSSARNGAVSILEKQLFLPQHWTYMYATSFLLTTITTAKKD